jgi:hypothetical protein
MSKRQGVRMRAKKSFVQPNMPFEHYQGIDALNVSLLKELQHSPRLFRYRQLHRKESAAMKRGTAAHTATLEPARYEIDYAVWSRKTESGRSAPRNGKAWEEFQAQHAGFEILSEDEAIVAQGIATAVRSDPHAAKYLASGQPEVTIVWKHGKRVCKGRVDWLTEIDGEPVLVGLKTARDCRPGPFGSAAARLGYALQWHWYAWGYKAITKKTPRVVEIVVDAEAPHSVVTYTIPDDVLGYGATECERLLDVLARCEKRNEWPGPADSEIVFTLPAWAWKDDDAEDVGGGEALDWEGVTA